MSAMLDIQEGDIESVAWDMYARARVPCQEAMAERFKAIAVNNFGFSGEDRPAAWPILSKGYADEFHDGNRIPKLILSGELQESITVSSEPDAAIVHAQAEYAANHQFGDESTNLPARPFFPMFPDGSLTPYSFNAVMVAAQDAAESVLS